MKLLAPSILSADFSNLNQQIRLIEMAGADIIHCDIMDGQFVPNITFGPFIVNAIRKITKLPIDVHLMIKNPDNFISEFVDAGANYISVHFEEVVHLNRTINGIKESGVKAGVVINPSTPVHSLSSILEDVDFVLIMSVNPGFGGQKFIPSSIKKINELNRMKKELNLNFQIETDGGINKDNLKDVIIAGTDIVVAGASIFNADNVSAAVTEFKNIISSI